MKVIDTIWFGNITGCAGIVIAEDDNTGERKAYLGVGRGENEKVDINRILQYGTKLSAQQLRVIVSQLEQK